MIPKLFIKHSRRTLAPDFEMPDGFEGVRARWHDQVPLEDLVKYPQLNLFAIPIKLEAKLFPVWLRFNTEEKEFQDWYALPKMPGFMFVSERVAKKIEELEPGVHQFFELQLLQNDGTVAPCKYYSLNIMNVIFSIDVQSSEGYYWKQFSPNYEVAKYLLKTESINKIDTKDLNYFFRVHFSKKWEVAIFGTNTWISKLCPTPVSTNWTPRITSSNQG